MVTAIAMKNNTKIVMAAAKSSVEIATAAAKSSVEIATTALMSSNEMTAAITTVKTAKVVLDDRQNDRRDQ